MHNNYMIAEIQKWLDENIISPEQAHLLTARYSTKNKKNPLLIIFSVIGALMIAAGIALMIATGWDKIPHPVQCVIAFLPLVSAQITAVYSLVKQKTSSAWREGFSVFYSLTVFASLKIVESVFNLPSDYSRYILLCGIMILPIFIIFRSVIACAGYMFAVISWGFVNTDPDSAGSGAILSFVLMTVLVAFGVFHLITTTKKAEPFIRTLAEWICAAAVFSVVMVFVEMEDICVPLTLLLMFNILLTMGKPSAAYSTPFVSAGTAGTFIMMFFVATRSLRFDEEDRRAGVFVFTAVLIVLLCAAAAVNVRDARRLCITVSNVLSSVLILIGLKNTTGEELPGVYLIPSGLFLFICGILYLRDGIKENRLTYVNIGLISVAAVLSEWLSATEAGNLIKGLFFLAAGCSLLAANLVIIKRTRKDIQPSGEEVTYEIQ